MAAKSSPQKVLVVGATGATGKHVVAKLLEQKIPTKVIVRSKERFLTLLPVDETAYDENLLTVTEASLLDLSDEEIGKQVADCTAVISCLGHNLTFSGMWGHPRRLVTDAATKFTQAMIKATKDSKDKTGTSLPKFILMGSDGVANPDGTDDERSFTERTILSLLRLLIPPHVDNEMAAAYFANTLGTECDSLEWTIVRPTDLVDESATKEYQLFNKPQGSLFGSGQATRSSVAQCMVDLLTNKKDLWQQYKYKMPVLHDSPAPTDDEQKEATTK